MIFVDRRREGERQSADISKSEGTKSQRLGGRVRQRWFLAISATVLECNTMPFLLPVRSDRHADGVLSGLTPDDNNCLLVAVCGSASSQYYMHLRSLILPRQNSNQAPDLEGIHREMHGIAEKIRVMNELDARLVQHLTVLLKIAKMPVVRVSHKVFIANLPAITLGMEGKVEILRLLDHNPPAAGRKSRPARKLTSEEDCLSHMAVLPDTAAMHQPNRSSRIWMLGSTPFTPASRRQ
ncbi:hypothetical protein Acr_12g0001780 [Actinidia rufa]|uniref:Uncharacterized protein n=1 Tax=Actinidia rufa TaxID=165716 RepID=A0A7J0FIA6_9ERIC|nr:hypothetical protein Acr_12g0001780 [Actinidia rufa]